jgi:hypothetical protein
LLLSPMLLRKSYPYEIPKCNPVGLASYLPFPLW